MSSRGAIEEEARRAAAPVRSGLKASGVPLPSWAVVLGSGLQSPPYFDERAPLLEWGFEDLPGLLPPSAAGHLGVLQVGTVGGRAVLLQRGRLHYYEAADMRAVCLPVFLLRELGISNLFLSNAAGALHPSFRRGEFMLVRDHINLMGTNPLLALASERRGDRFLDLTGTYHRELGDRLLSLAGENGITVREGTLVAVPGPCYETPAETRFLRAIGGDAVSMSLVPEAVCARWLGLRTVALSCITNVHGSPEEHGLSHQEVLAVAEGSAGALEKLLRLFIREG
jgi:purine-nucleoside phosphorylase